MQDRHGRNGRVAMLAAAILLLAGTARAETAWIAGGQRANVRSAPDVDARALGYADPADRVELLETSGGWSHVKTHDGVDGWVVSSRLQTDPPTGARAAAMASDLDELRGKLARADETAKQLRAAAEQSSAKEREQKAEIGRLVAAQEAVHGDVRWREWITGAGILLGGMLIGALLSRTQARRSGAQRLRL